MLAAIVLKSTTTKVTFSDIDPMHAFHWLLDKDDQLKLHELTKLLVSSVSSSIPKAIKANKPSKGKAA
eukprot:6062082-Heterocapsa_arctica.AAC.1